MNRMHELVNTLEKSVQDLQGRREQSSGAVSTETSNPFTPSVMDVVNVRDIVHDLIREREARIQRASPDFARIQEKIEQLKLELNTTE